MTGGWLTEASVARPRLLFGLICCDPACRQIGPAILSGAGVDWGRGFSVFFKHFPGTRRASIVLLQLDVDSARHGPCDPAYDERLLFSERRFSRSSGVNYLNTQIALVEAGQGIAIIPRSPRLSGSKNSHGPPHQSCRAPRLLRCSKQRKKTRQWPALSCRLTIATWAGRSGIL